MARRKPTRARLAKLLPLATEGGVLVGIIPDEWQLSFRECCADPWWDKGYRRYRAARCVLCLRSVNAHEYLVAEEG